MTIDTVFGIYAVALGLVMAVMIGGFTLVFMEIHRISGKLDAFPETFAALRREMAAEFQAQRVEMTAEFRAQRAEVSAQTAALAGVIMAARS